MRAGKHCGLLTLREICDKKKGGYAHYIIRNTE
jgi:hypothetical protein